MTPTLTTVDEAGQSALIDTASGPWSADMLPQRIPIRQPARGSLYAVRVLFSVALSPLTSLADPWAAERGRQNPPTSYVIIEYGRRDRISRAEALRIARQILERAERERVESAVQEANRGIQWGEAE